MGSDTVPSVVASNFQRSFRVRQQTDREYRALPADVRAVIEAVHGSEAPRLSDGGD